MDNYFVLPPVELLLFWKMSGRTVSSRRASHFIGLMSAATARSRAESALTLDTPAAAVTWAQLACTLSHDAPEDIVLLTRALLAARQPRRATQLLLSSDLLPRSNGCRLLLAKSYAACNLWEAVLETLGHSDATAPPLDTSQQPAFEPLEHVQSTACLLRAQAHEQLDNREEAAQCYAAALKLDPLCMEAFDKIIQGALLPPAPEKELFEALDWSRVPEAEAKVMKAYYRSRSSKYGPLNLSSEEAALASSLSNNREMRLAQAERLYIQCRFRDAYAETTKLLDEDAYDAACLPLHIACQVELRDTNNLFYLAHRLVEADPKQALPWFAVGCYYYLTRNADEARRYLLKAIHINNSFGPVWIAFGHAFAMEGEHDQAMSAYSTAARLLPGSHLPLLFIGRAYAGMSNFPLAIKYLESAKAMCDTDPNVHHELGILYGRKSDGAAATACLERALELMESLDAASDRHREPTLAALGRTWHMRGDFDKAEAYFRRALALNTQCADTHAGLGFVYQSRGQADLAVECYHEALSIDPHDTFSKQMLEVALVEELQLQLSSISLPET